MPIPCSHFPKELPTELGFQTHSHPSNKAKHPSKQTSPQHWEGSWSWPGLEAAESSPAGHSKAQIVWQGLVPADRAQILWQPKAHWKLKFCLVGSNQSWHVGLLAGKHKHPALEAEGRRNWGIGNNEADQATSICCWRVAQSRVYWICLAEGRARGCYLGEQGQPPSIPSIIADLAAAQGGSVLPLNPFSASKCPLLGVKWYLNSQSITTHDHQLILQHLEPVGSAE